jgi:hypothetical protein
MSRTVALKTPKMNPTRHAPPSLELPEQQGQQMMRKIAVEMHQALGANEVNVLCIWSMESRNSYFVLPDRSQLCFQSIVDRFHK